MEGDGKDRGSGDQERLPLGAPGPRARGWACWASRFRRRLIGFRGIEAEFLGERHLHQISLWSWSLNEDRGQSDAAELMLSEVEKARAARFVEARHRQRFIAAKVCVRTILGAHVGVAPQALVFVENEFGKPRLVCEPTIHFSLSHSEDRAILAISDTIEVGVDIEEIRPLDHLDLAQRYFCAGELATIERLPSVDQLTAFFQTWTLKEAVVKALGKGLSIPLDEFEVSIATTPPRLVVCPDGSGPTDAWELRLLTPVHGYSGALAVPGAASAVELIQRTC